MAEPLKLVRTLDQAKDDVIRDLRTNWKSISDLERKHGLNRSILVDLQKKFDPTKKNRNIVKIPRAPKAPVFVPLPLDPSVAKPSTAITAYFIGAFLILLGFAASGIGGYMNWEFGYAVWGLPGAVIGLIVDGGALLFLSASRELFRQRNPLCIIALLAWLPFVSGSTYAALNYTGVHVGDYFKNRSDAADHETDLLQQKARLEAKRPKEARSISEIDLAIMNAHRDDRPALRKLRDIAVERDKIDAQITDLNQQLRTLPHVASKNPAAEQVAQMSGGRLDAEQAASYNIRWWAVVPGFASIMLTLGLAMFAKDKPVH